MEASPRLRTTPVSTGGPASGGGALGDEAIWKRLREAGFDEETVRRRDKAALISYIAKLESEMYDYQHHMGMLILEKKEWTSKYQQIRAAADSAQNEYQRDKVTNSSALAEAKKREENLKKALGIEKECVANLEKALHDMRAEIAERELAYESKLAEASIMAETAQKKLDEAESKLRAAEVLHADASRCRDTAVRSLQDVEAREDELRRRVISFNSECDAKENEISLQKNSLYESKKVIHEEEEKIQEKQILLNQREEYISQRLKELTHFDKKLTEAKANYEEDSKALKEEKSHFNLNVAALATREEALFEKESMLDKQERELLILQEKIANKEFDDIRRRIEEHHSALQRKTKEFEAEIEQRRMFFEDEISTKSTALADREQELVRREKLISDRENAFDLELRTLAEKQEDITKKLKVLEDKEQELQSTQSLAEAKIQDLQKEKEDIQKLKEDLAKVKSSLDFEKEEILLAEKKLELTVSERNELLILETKLKEEIDSFRTQKMGLEAEADKLKADKEKFEAEWELIDEKRQELEKEAERIAQERKVVSEYLKDELDCIRQEKEILRSQFKNNSESLSREQEEFRSKMEHEHSDWFNKIQKEREAFVKHMEIQRRELEVSIDKRREEIDGYLRQREEEFERERAKELHHIHSQKETIAKELEHVASELKRLSNERIEIALDREQREKEWSEIKNSVEMLNIQREKLQKQRELLHVDREEINKQIEHLKKLEDLNIESENRVQNQVISSRQVPVKKCSDLLNVVHGKDSDEKGLTVNGNSTLMLLPKKVPETSSPPASATIAWVRKCAGIIFNRSPEKLSDANDEKYIGKKIPTKFAEMSAENEIISNPNLLENVNSVDYGILPGSSIVSRVRRSEKEKRRGQKKDICSKSNLVDSGMMPKVPGLVKNSENMFDVELKNREEKTKQLTENVVGDMGGQTTRSIGSDVTLLLGKRRLNTSQSPGHADVQFETSRKHKKRRETVGDDVEDNISNCEFPKQSAHSDDDGGLLSHSEAIGCQDISLGGVDKEHEVLEDSNSKPSEVLPNAMLHTDILESGRSYALQNSARAGNGILSSTSDQNGKLKTPDKANKVCMEAEELLKNHIVSAAEVTCADGGNSIEDAKDQDVDEEDEEDEDRMSIKERLWFFLTT